MARYSAEEMGSNFSTLHGKPRARARSTIAVANPYHDTTPAQVALIVPPFDLKLFDRGLSALETISATALASHDAAVGAPV